MTAAVTTVSPLLDSAELQRRLPTLSEAADAESMRERLGRVRLFDGVVASCRPVKMLVGEDSCSVRYQTSVLGGNGADARLVLLLGRVLTTPQAAQAYRARVARQAAGATSIVSIDELNLVLHPFPLDPGLPTLPAVTRERTVLPVLSRLLATEIDACTIDVIRYPREGRCVLRYGTGALDVFGKVYGDDTAALSTRLLAAVRALLAGSDGAEVHLRVPRPFGHDPRLRLALAERVPGVSPVLKDQRQWDRLVLTAGRVAGHLHRLELRLPRRRTVTTELAWLEREATALRGIWPDIAAECDRWLRFLRAATSTTAALPPRFGHGDFTPSQLLLDRGSVAIVDFDDAAVAEPALDLGRFLAHLRLGLARDDIRPDTDRSIAMLVESYREATDRREVGSAAAAFTARVALCASFTLLASVLRSCRQLKDARLARALALLSKEAACLS